MAVRSLFTLWVSLRYELNTLIKYVLFQNGPGAVKENVFVASRQSVCL